MLVALLGTLKAGGAYRAGDPAMPQDRQGMILKDAQVAIMITQRSLVASLAAGTPVFNWECRRSRACGGECRRSQPSPSRWTNLAYMIYTSDPRRAEGVELEHRSLVNFLASMKKCPGIVPTTCFCRHDAFLRIAGLELAAAGDRRAYRLLSRDESSDGFQLLKYINEEKVTILQAVPATWRMLLETQWAGSPQLKMLCGGEGLPRELANRLLAKGGELWNMYGPTETTIWSTVARIQDDKAPIVGEPVANTQTLHPRPQSPARSRWCQRRTAHWRSRPRARLPQSRRIDGGKIHQDPFSNEPGVRMYKTDNLARIRGQGQIEVQGQIDHRVKIRGFRIELW